MAEMEGREIIIVTIRRREREKKQLKRASC
jgi:hypothetical protein